MMRATARYLAPGIWLVVLLAMMGLLGHLLRKPNRVVVRNSGATPLSSLAISSRTTGPSWDVNCTIT